MSAKFDEFPSLPFQDIKEKPKRHGRKDGRMWKQYTPHPLTNIVWEGYNKMASAPAKTQISLGIHLLSLIRVFAVCMKKAWVLSYPMSTQWRLIRQGEGGMPRLIWVFAGCTVILLVLSWGGSIDHLNVCLKLKDNYSHRERVTQCPSASRWFHSNCVKQL